MPKNFVKIQQRVKNFKISEVSYNIEMINKIQIASNLYFVLIVLRTVYVASIAIKSQHFQHVFKITQSYVELANNIMKTYGWNTFFKHKTASNVSILCFFLLLKVPRRYFL